MRYMARVWGYFLLRFMPLFYLINVPQSTLKKSFWEAEYLVPNCTPLIVVSLITRRDLTSNAIFSLPDGVFKGMTNLFYLYVLAKHIFPSIHPAFLPSIYPSFINSSIHASIYRAFFLTDHLNANIVGKELSNTTLFLFVIMFIHCNQ